MNWKINLICLLVLVSACKSEPKVIDLENQYLLEVEELMEIKERDGIKLLDFRKKKAYENGHIPGALHIWRSDIEDNTYDYKGMMASLPAIEILFSQLGIQSKDTIIIYDDNGLCDASRLWWLLQNYDFSNVRLLHGGLAGWKEKGGEISKENPSIEESIFSLEKDPSMKYHVSKEDIQLAMENKTVILDTRTEDEFTGKRKKKGAAKGGRIPGSIWIDWAESINFHGDKRLRPIAELEKIYNKMAISKNDPIIVYCHSGVRSAHTSFVLTELLGYTNVKNYDGSWTEWSHFDDLAIEKDSLVSIFE